jgi:hypothetical protein
MPVQEMVSANLLSQCLHPKSRSLHTDSKRIGCPKGIMTSFVLVRPDWNQFCRSGRAPMLALFPNSDVNE